MKKTFRTVDFLFALFTAWAFMFLYYDVRWLAFVAICAATVCGGLAIGSLVYDVFYLIRSRREGGDQQ